jgi:hypothetical protein
MIERFEQNIIYNLFYSWNDILNDICSTIRISPQLKPLFDSTVSSFKENFIKNLSSKNVESVDMPNLRG